ncbi:hypothetical protein [Actinomadura yumaensis]|uniref:Uncharacterized protein n=1 Tax=Actinomadura yumaensis TaxID=111807 RepID=A0ABW2CJN6_9ACTN
MRNRDDDLRLTEALREQRPGAVGHVYNVYGPELFEYARGMLGEREPAVEAVRAALLKTRVDPDAVPGADGLEEWLRGLVRDECGGRGAKASRRWPRLVVAGVAATALTLTAGLLLMPDDPRGPKRNAPVDAAMAPPVPSSPSPSPSRTKKAEKKKPEKTRKAKPKKKERARPKPPSKPSGRGRLAIGDGGCRGIGVAGLPRTCRVILTARGGPVRWSVASVSSRAGWVSAGGGGTLASGRSAAVTVTVRPTIGCYIRGGGGGSISFAPGGTARVSYTCWRR